MKTLEEIEAEFVAQIEVPKPQLAEQIFVCPVGLVGAGKTTVIKPIARALGLVRVSSDELRKLLKENGYGYDALKEIGLRVVSRFVGAGHGIALDMDCGNIETQDFVKRTAAERGAKVFWVHVTAPEQFIFEKFRRHPPSWLADNPNTMIENYRQQKARREREGSHFDFDFIFDTSREDLDVQVEMFLNRVTRGVWEPSEE